MDKKKRTNEWGRHRVQILWAFLTNSYLVGFAKGKIYQGKLKNLCVPGLNCYSCPGALGACPIGAMQAVVGSWNFKLAFYVAGFLMFVGARRRRQMIVLFTLLALVLGLFCGLSGFDPAPVSFLSRHSDMVLYILMFSVGISIGMHNGILKKIRQYHLKILIIPLGITVGSIIGGLICAVILGISPAEGAAVASGMGWYSLAGVTISRLGGAELGSIAFMSNLMREFFSFFLIPIIASRLNNYTCIAPAAATSEDTTLPVLLKYTNEETVVLAVLNGILCSFFVPILITFFFNI